MPGIVGKGWARVSPDPKPDDAPALRSLSGLCVFSDGTGGRAADNVRRRRCVPDCDVAEGVASVTALDYRNDRLLGCCAK